jgi:lipopolysaccharide biosynthesis protein
MAIPTKFNSEGNDIISEPQEKNKVRLIAFYLPQYHPIPENDAWWGKGFTEWANVTQARPLFLGHYQPHFPADLGFYDLRLPEVRQSQADLAREYGIYGFCYYHYWFDGKQLLERPFSEVLASGKPDFRFCLCWANESWTRRWDGFDQDVLIEQTYGGESDAQNHIRWLLQAFADERYIQINGKPLLLVYRAREIPHIERILSIWREEANRAGLPGLYLCSVESIWSRNWDPTGQGFEAAVEFHPAFGLLPRKLLERRQSFSLWPWGRKQPKHWIVSYKDYVQYMLQRHYPNYKMFRCVTPGFDNTSRRQNGLHASILQQSNPEDFGIWLHHTVRWTKNNRPESEQIVFINAWNEWAEGNHLEPDQRFGHAFLEQVRIALRP